MAFQSIYTNDGLARIAQAEATSTPLNLTQMAVGDGNGNAVEPDSEQTALVRERFRAPVNRVFQVPGDPQRFAAELIIPSSEGGFTLREVGVFDADGHLIVVGNLPDTYKPVLAEGAYSDTVVRVEFVVSNVAVITLSVDPNVALATQSWIAANVNAAFVIPGGTTNQFLRKLSNANGAYEWSGLDDLNVVVDIIEEQQLLAESQTQVDWATVTTDSLSVYINGVRLHRGAGVDEWQAAAPPDNVTRIILGQSYPAATRILGVQNEPLGAITEPLAKDQNLADAPDKAAVRTNINVYSRAEADARGKQPGDVFFTARTTAPARSLKANGAAVSRVAYADLFAAIGTTAGAGDGSTTFNVPDCRGEFLRGWDDARGVDVGRVIGSTQSSSLASHAHSASATAGGSHTHAGNTDGGGSHAHGGTTTFGGSHTHNYESMVRVDDSDRGTGNSWWSIDSFNPAATTGAAGSHAHFLTTDTAAAHSHSFTTYASSDHSHGITVNATGGLDTWPRNVALLACIAY